MDELGADDDAVMLVLYVPFAASPLLMVLLWHLMMMTAMMMMLFGGLDDLHSLASLPHLQMRRKAYGGGRMWQAQFVEEEEIFFFAA